MKCIDSPMLIGCPYIDENETTWQKRPEGFRPRFGLYGNVRVLRQP